MKSRSSRKSESESELRTASLPFDKTRLLAREFAEVCDVVGGNVSIDVMTVSSAVGASTTSAMVEAFGSKDIDGPAADFCTRSGSAVLATGGCATFWLGVFAATQMVSLRLQLPVCVSQEAKV